MTPAPNALVAHVEHILVDAGQIRMHAAVAGPEHGPAVLLCHGFPESWYSWRYQLAALADAGYRVIAPDQRGYGRTDAPWAVEEYSHMHLVGDLVGLLDALGVERATVVGHDHGAPVAWAAALFRPDRFPAVVGVSVPFFARLPGMTAPIDDGRRNFGHSFFYVNYFLQPGVAEAEMDRDIRGTLRRLLYSLSADIPASDFRFFDPDATCLAEALRDTAKLPEWLTEGDLDVFTAEFERKGTFRYGLNWYRTLGLSWELTAPWVNAPIGQPALFIGAERDVIFGQTQEGIEATRASVPQLRAEWVPDCGHWIQQEEPVAFNGLLLEFLADHAGG